MTTLLLLILFFLCTWLLIWGFRKPERMIQYPFLAAAVFTGWVLPQLLGLSNSLRLPAGALEKTIFMTFLCVMAIYLGHTINKVPLRAWNWRFSRKRLLIAAAALSLGGAYFYYQVSLLAEEATLTHGGAWTGIITIYVFFATMLTFGLVLALLSYLQEPSRWALLIVLFDLMFYLDRIIMRGRRQAAVEFLVILGLASWFHHRKLPPRWAVALVLITGALWVNSVGQYRSTMIAKEGLGFRGVLAIDFVDNFKSIFSVGGEELKNAVYDIQGADRLASFDFGLSHWNGFVHNYIPGQIVGNDFKKGLMFEFDDAAYREFSHIPHYGSTHTGMSDSFASFWYFGALKFFIISFVMAKLYRAANQGHLVAQMLLMLVFVGALESITHTTDRFFMIWPKIAAFLLPALWYARSKFRHRFQCPVAD